MYQWKLRNELRLYRSLPVSQSCKCSPFFCRQSKTSVTYILHTSIMPLYFTELASTGIFQLYSWTEVFFFSEKLYHFFSFNISISSAIFSLKGITSSMYNIAGENENYTANSLSSLLKVHTTCMQSVGLISLGWVHRLKEIQAQIFSGLCSKDI